MRALNMNTAQTSQVSNTCEVLLKINARIYNTNCGKFDHLYLLNILGENLRERFHDAFWRPVFTHGAFVQFRPLAVIDHDRSA
ncbi:hypothetical protein U14_00061 [Candidatus Moduliflexus flocculans]|uniref:Uncharacterized protein n=1 Tax=Candidatus Moduliflexus flocculans TaxID=1499966 RepID=A0A0S6VPH2_9BACT|nr:hypothetical protein U14_00061 [Candidatus Moduliflexus flocculans]